MRWIEFSVVVSGETAEAVTDLFSQYSHSGGVAIQELTEPEELRVGPQSLTQTRRVRVAAYTPIPENEDSGAIVAMRQGLRDGLAYLDMITPVGTLQERAIADEDWESAWREHYHPHRVGHRSVVVPTWRDYEPEPDDIVIHLDPGMAFGTGLHPTTQLCARELEKRVQTGQTVLDVGCGSGILPSSPPASTRHTRSESTLTPSPSSLPTRISNTTASLTSSRYEKEPSPAPAKTPSPPPKRTGRNPSWLTAAGTSSLLT